MSTLTTKEWIARARSGGDVEACLAAAEQAVSWPDDWLELARAWRQFGQLELALVAIEMALARAAGEHWPSVRAAELLLELGQRDAAAAALGRIEAALKACKPEDSRVYTWVLLARAYRDVLHDEAGVAASMAGAGERAHSPKDLIELAEGHARLFKDSAKARELLERAEELALEHGDCDVMWTLAIGWRSAAQDEVRARRAMELGTEHARQVQTLTSLATGWYSLYRDEDAIRRALARAESLAAQVRDWLILAEALRDGGHGERQTPFDPQGVRRCLEAALRADPPPNQTQRTEIATGFRRWLGDDAAAEAVLPTNLTPEAALEPFRTLADWPERDSRALLHCIRALATPDILKTIASADYGSDYSKHLQALTEIQSTGSFPPPLDWYPREVLELTRWGRGELSRDGHIARALSCAVLAIDAALPDCRQAGQICDVLAPLISSALALGFDKELELFLVWLCEHLEYESEYVWALLALVLVAARRAPDDPRLPALIEQLEQIESLSHPERPKAGWLFRTTLSKGHEQLWRGLIAELLGPTLALPLPPAPHWQRLGALLRGEDVPLASG